VILVTPSAVESHHLAFEAGMAMAWNKPIYVLYDGVGDDDIPEFLRQFQVLPVTKVDEVAKTIERSKSKFSAEDMEVLVATYIQNSVPVDALLLQPTSLSQLTDEFNSMTGQQIGGERVARELMRLRKSGKLPRISPTFHPA
jgi:hypothetical protein